jgi:hypothetical protein
MTEEQKRQRKAVYAVSGGVCEVCGRPLIDGQPQGAHRIANTKTNRYLWGANVIDHPLNMAMTCSLKCNQAVNIGMDEGKCWRLVKKIVDSELRRFGDD